MDRVNSPNHYKSDNNRYEVIDIIEFFNLNFHRGNVLKYLLRSGKKTEEGYDNTAKEVEDLEKAIWYLKREVKRIKDSSGS